MKAPKKDNTDAAANLLRTRDFSAPFDLVLAPSIRRLTRNKRWQRSEQTVTLMLRYIFRILSCYNVRIQEFCKN